MLGCRDVHNQASLRGLLDGLVVNQSIKLASISYQAKLDVAACLLD
jgi:hypothetical protein